MNIIKAIFLTAIIVGALFGLIYLLYHIYISDTAILIFLGSLIFLVVFVVVFDKLKEKK